MLQAQAPGKALEGRRAPWKLPTLTKNAQPSRGSHHLFLLPVPQAWPVVTRETIAWASQTLQPRNGEQNPSTTSLRLNSLSLP